MAGQVDREQRAAERQRERVPGVRVLPAAVQQHQLRFGVAPGERGHGLPVGTVKWPG